MPKSSPFKGSSIKIGSSSYSNISLLSSAGWCSTTYTALCPKKKKVVIKCFPEGKKACSHDARKKNNHFGQLRDVSTEIFDYVKKMGSSYPFLLKFIDRYRVDHQWILVTEFIEGQLLSSYFDKNISDTSKLEKASEILGKTLKQWHLSGFAHGDPHLKNAIIKELNGDPISIKLIDLNMIHHSGLSSCQKKGCCFDEHAKKNRFKEDLINTFPDLGNGFLNDIKKYGHGSKLENAFFKGYS